MQQNAKIHLLQEHRKRRQNVDAFATLIKTPAASFTMPANGRLAIQGAFAGGSVLTLTGATTQTLNAPALAAGQIYVLGAFEKDAKVVVTTGANVYLDTGMGVYSKIGAA